jgi:hypothetical protein
MDGMNIKINGFLIRVPSDCGIQKFKITKSKRIANGDMKMDLVAKKRKILITYDVISGPELKAIENILYGDDVFFTAEFFDGEEEPETMVVYAGDIDYKRFRTDGIWYWKDLTFNLIQQ